MIRTLCHSASLTVATDTVPIFLDALEPFSESVNAFEINSPLPGGEADAPKRSVGVAGEGTALINPLTLTLSPGERGNTLWTITAILKADADTIQLRNAIALAAAAANIAEPCVTIAPLEDIDYLAMVPQNFPPFRIGKFYLYGSHHTPRAGDGPLRLLVNAGTAFGSGEHPTTQGCLLAMQDLAKKKYIGRVIDMGCGSGILSLAAAKLWRASVIAVDIDDEAARVTRANAKLNGVPGLIRSGSGNGYQAPIVTRAAPADLIVCNIVANPLKRMAPDLARNLKPGGYAILSGLLDHQLPGVLAAHYAQGLRLVKHYPIGEWRSVMLRR